MSPFSRGTVTGGSRVDPAPKASGAFWEGDPNLLWGRSLEKQSRAARRAQELARSGAREIRGRKLEDEITRITGSETELYQVQKSTILW
jgi:hypothetical protein